MAISIDCPQCGKTLKAKDSAAGKTAKCPACEELITIPFIDEVYDAEEIGVELANPEQESVSHRSYHAPRIPEVSRRACPACGEMIPEKARKCGHCEVIFDSELKTRAGPRRSSRERRDERPPLADLRKRFFGALIDGILTVILIGPGLGMISAADADGPHEDLELLGMGAAILLLGLLVLLVLQISLLATRSQSFGKLLARTKLMDYQTDQPARFGKTFLLRGVLGQGASYIPVLGCLYLLIDTPFILNEEHRCLHDLIAGTYVADIS